jgi:hypothetical protein
MSCREDLDAVALNTMLVLQPCLLANATMTGYGAESGKCFHLFGFDVMVTSKEAKDSNQNGSSSAKRMKVHLLEINAGPSLNINTLRRLTRDELPSEELGEAAAENLEDLAEAAKVAVDAAAAAKAAGGPRGVGGISKSAAARLARAAKTARAQAVKTTRVGNRLEVRSGQLASLVPPSGRQRSSGTPTAVATTLQNDKTRSAGENSRARLASDLRAGAEGAVARCIAAAGNTRVAVGLKEGGEAGPAAGRGASAARALSPSIGLRKIVSRVSSPPPSPLRRLRVPDSTASGEGIMLDPAPGEGDSAAGQDGSRSRPSAEQDNDEDDGEENDEEDDVGGAENQEDQEEDEQDEDQDQDQDQEDEDEEDEDEEDEDEDEQDEDEEEQEEDEQDEDEQDEDEDQEGWQQQQQQQQKREMGELGAKLGARAVTFAGGAGAGAGVGTVDEEDGGGRGVAAVAVVAKAAVKERAPCYCREDSYPHYHEVCSVDWAVKHSVYCGMLAIVLENSGGPSTSASNLVGISQLMGSASVFTDVAGESDIDSDPEYAFVRTLNQACALYSYCCGGGNNRSSTVEGEAPRVPKPGYSSKSVVTGDVRSSAWRKLGVQYCLQAGGGQGIGQGVSPADCLPDPDAAAKEDANPTPDIADAKAARQGKTGKQGWNASRAASVVDGLYQRARIDLVKQHKEATGGGGQTNPTLTFSHFVTLLEGLAVQVCPELSPIEALTDIVTCPEVLVLLEA